MAVSVMAQHMCTAFSLGRAPTQVSGWFNPSFLIALWVRGRLSAGDFFALFAAELVGYFIGRLPGFGVAMHAMLARSHACMHACMSA